MQLTALSLALTRIGLGGFGVGSALNLDFTSGNQSLDPRITFSRASNATVTGPDGALGYAPHNLLTHSEQFDNAVWTGAASASPNTNSAPNGTVTSDTLTASSNYQSKTQFYAIAANVSHTFSVYVLKTASAAGFPGISIYSGSSAVSATVNTNTGAVTPRSGEVPNSVTSVSAGDYWRVSITHSFASTGASSVVVYPRVNVDGSGTWIGGSGSAVFWGAQLNVGPLQPYYPTTVKNALGFTQEFDNAAWTKSNAFVQTNLLTFSEQFDNAAWVKTRDTITTNAAIDPQGYATADKLVIDTTPATNHSAGQNASITSGTTYTLSMYAKASEFTQINLRFSAQFPAGNTFFDLSDGTKANAGTVVDSTITPVGNGWYRCSFTQTANASGTAAAQVFLAQAGAITIADANGSDGVLLWGAQLVQGSTPGDYQRTEAAAKAVMYPAPDGSLTADKLVENATPSGTFVLFASATTASPSTLSFYLKAAERSWVNVRHQGLSCFINLSSGSVGTVDVGLAALVTPAGNGWYRCSVTKSSSGSGAIGLRLATGDGADVYTGDGTSGIYIWGAQLSDSASLDPYVYNPEAAPTAQAYYGPRFDYDPVTLAPKGLLIEEQRVNHLLHSEDFAQAAWVKANTTATANTETAPSGLIAADTLAATAANGTTRQAITTTAADWTFSIYLKRKTGSGAVAVSMNGTTWVDQTISSTAWTRCVVTQTGVAGTSNPGVRLAASGDEVYAWGAQAE